MLGGILSLFALPAGAILPFLLNGENVQGKVTSAPALVNPPKFGPKYVVRFQYDTRDGNTHQGAGRVRSAGAFKPGDPIPVRYLRSDPGRSRLETNIWEAAPAILFSLAGIVLIVGAIWRGVSGVRRINSQIVAAAPAESIGVH